MGNFGAVKDYVFPTWLALMVVFFIFFETRKQYYRFFTKGSAHVCACVDVVNEEFGDTAHGKNKPRPRLVPRTEDLIIYSVLEFNNKVLNREKGGGLSLVAPSRTQHRETCSMTSGIIR